MPDIDFPSERGGYNALGKPSDVKMEQAIVGASFQRIGRAVTSRRKALEFKIAKLSGEVMKRFWQLQVEADNVWGQPNDVSHAGGDGKMVWNGLRHDLEVGDDPRLTGMDEFIT